jgi:hypothetical protein
MRTGRSIDGLAGQVMDQPMQDICPGLHRAADMNHDTKLVQPYEVDEACGSRASTFHVIGRVADASQCVHDADLSYSWSTGVLLLVHGCEIRCGVHRL